MTALGELTENASKAVDNVHSSVEATKTQEEYIANVFDSFHDINNSILSLTDNMNAVGNMIKPNSVLIFNVKLTDVKEAKKETEKKK